MACMFPMKAYRTSVIGKSGKRGITFAGTKAFRPANDAELMMTLPCGQCIGCRIARADSWGIRSMHEAKMAYEAGTGSAFLTLTYAPEHLPADNSVRKEVLQKFLKRLRKMVGVTVRFLGCGEYGETNGRAHYHVVLFGWRFPDRRLAGRSRGGEQLYESDLLNEAWPFGRAVIGDVTFQSGRYVASYVMKHVNEAGPKWDAAYVKANPDTGEVHTVEPEFQLMSLKPGLGQSWFEKYKADVYPHDYVVVQGSRRKPPRYYDGKLPPAELAVVQAARKAKALSVDPAEVTKARLRVRSICRELAVSRLKREV